MKARYHSEKLDNIYRTRQSEEAVFRAQLETYKYYEKNVEDRIDKV